MQGLGPMQEWLRRKLTPMEDGTPPAYVSICPQEGRRSYPQRARVNVGDKAPPQVVEDVCAAIADLAESRRAEENPLVRVRLSVYGPKGLDSFGDMVFVVGAELSAGERADGDGTREGETVAVLREMRILMTEAVQSLGRASSSGYTLALEAMRENARLAHELAEHKAALMLAETQQQGGGLEEAAKQLLPVVAAKLMMPASSAPIMAPIIGDGGGNSSGG